MEGLDYIGADDSLGESVSEKTLRNEALRTGSSRVFKYGRDGKVALASGAGSCGAVGDVDAWMYFICTMILLFILLQAIRLWIAERKA